MKIKYFTDTDTALVEFSDRQVAQTKEINENIYVDLDADGNLVNMTIEHASKQANIAEVAYQQMKSKSAWTADIAEITGEALKLQQAYTDAGILPAKYSKDGLHYEEKDVWLRANEKTRRWISSQAARGKILWPATRILAKGNWTAQKTSKADKR
jgi:uncharacterized protein YuzE